VVLHTTEAPTRSSLRSLKANGEAHYLVGWDGRVYAIIKMEKVAYHAGRSMWNGVENLDACSVGIEVAGYHDRDITEAQYLSLRALLEKLQTFHNIPDERVLTHSMVAYGVADRWHKFPHRGRKRCGMIFATSRARWKLGLLSRPAHDPDVKAGRLTVGDAYLASILYGAARTQDTAIRWSAAAVAVDFVSEGRTPWAIAGSLYDLPTTTYVFPDGRRLRGDQIRDWSGIPNGTRVVIRPP
jgi:hypothetical protein